jgi:hypothetical protein
MDLRTSVYDCQVALKVQIGDFYFVNGTVLRLGKRQNLVQVLMKRMNFTLMGKNIVNDYEITRVI